MEKDKLEKHSPDKVDTDSSTSTNSEIFEANSCNEKLNENYYELEKTMDDIMANQKRIVKQESAQGFISQVSSSHILIEKEREKDEITTNKLYNLAEYDSNVEKIILESKNENIKKQNVLLKNASEAIAYNKDKNNINLKEDLNTPLKQKLDDLMTHRSLLTEIRELEIKSEIGVITSQEKDKLAELDALEFKLEKQKIEKENQNENLQNSSPEISKSNIIDKQYNKETTINQIKETNEKRSLISNIDPEQSTNKRKHEDSQQQDKPNKKSVLDYADPNLEMPSYIDPED